MIGPGEADLGHEARHPFLHVRRRHRGRAPAGKRLFHGGALGQREAHQQDAGVRELAAAAAGNRCPDAPRELTRRPRVADPHGMEISGSSPALIMMSKQLDAVRTTLAASQATAITPQDHAEVILDLSTAAQQLLLTSR